MLRGLNHLTLAVRDLPRSVDFYHRILGFQLDATWNGGAYLSLGSLWLCLSLDDAVPGEPRPDYTHVAFDIAQEDFPAFRARLRSENVIEWRQNKSEGDSLYFLDPDGHKLEVHSGSLATRLEACRRHPYAGMRIHDPVVTKPQIAN